MQVLSLSDTQIEQTYLYFEGYRFNAPEGVELRHSFTATMGRIWDNQAQEFVRL